MFIARGAYNLGQVERVVANGVEDQVLQLVDGRQQVIAECSHGAGCRSSQVLVALVLEVSRRSKKEKGFECKLSSLGVSKELGRRGESGEEGKGEGGGGCDRAAQCNKEEFREQGEKKKKK